MTCSSRLLPLYGVIALIVALYMSAVLPVNIAGVALITLAVLLFVAEIFTPSFGLLTAGGIGSFIIGGLLLFNDPTQAFRLSLPMVIPAALLTAASFFFVIGAGLRAQLLPVRAGILQPHVRLSRFLPRKTTVCARQLH